MTEEYEFPSLAEVYITVYDILIDTKWVGSGLGPSMLCCTVIPLSVYCVAKKIQQMLDVSSILSHSDGLFIVSSHLHCHVHT